MISHIPIGVSTVMIDSVREQTDGSFEVCSGDPCIDDTKLKYNNVSSGDNKTFCSYSCWSIRRTSLLCKHFFTIIDSGIKQYSDLTILFLDHPFTNLDRDPFDDNEIDNVPDPTVINDKFKKFEEKIEGKNIPDLMDSPDFKNVNGKNSFRVSILVAINCACMRLRKFRKL